MVRVVGNAMRAVGAVERDAAMDRESNASSCILSVVIIGELNSIFKTSGFRTVIDFIFLNLEKDLVDLILLFFFIVILLLFFFFLNEKNGLYIYIYILIKMISVTLIPPYTKL